MKKQICKITMMGLIVALAAISIDYWMPKAYGDGGDTTLIHACKRSNGTIRIVSPTQPPCPRKETPIHWSIAGPVGPAGPTGPTGPAGPTGPVSGVTASAPLTSSGGARPNISLPNVTIGTSNTAMGEGALQSTTPVTSNTAIGTDALKNNTGNSNTAVGHNALLANNSGHDNTAVGHNALLTNTANSWGNTAVGSQAFPTDPNTYYERNTAIGHNAGPRKIIGASASAQFGTDPGSGVFSSDSSNTTQLANPIGPTDPSGHTISNTTAIGAGAEVYASNTMRLGNTDITGIFAHVDITVDSDKNLKENFQPVDGKEVLRKIEGMNLTSWNFIGQDAKKFRHYGPIAQEFYAAFGNDGIGTIGTDKTINSGDMAGILMIAVQELEKQKTAQAEEIKQLKAENAAFKTRLDRISQMVGAHNLTQVVRQ